MPMHDWTRVDPNDYHDFHLSWIGLLKIELNRSVLPKGYYAMAEHSTPPIIGDVVTLSWPQKPAGSAKKRSDGAGVGVAGRPRTAIVSSAAGKKVREQAGNRRIVVRHPRDRRIVAVIEIVSPSNKAKKVEFDYLVRKSVQILRQGIHFLLVDPFPPSRRDPQGLYSVVWKQLTGQSFEPTAGKPLAFAAFVARPDDEFTAYVEPLAVGARVPDMPLFLTPDTHVLAPLRATYDAAWEGVAGPVRDAVLGSAR